MPIAKSNKYDRLEAKKTMKKTLIIDNYDSFTYILKQYFGELNGNPEVIFNDQVGLEEIKQINPTHLVLSPGPGTVEEPKDVGITFEALQYFENKIPILGVCLGHQAIGKYYGFEIIRAPKVMHGKRSNIKHSRKGIFEGMKNPLEVMRYHSLTIKRLLPNPSLLAITAEADDGVIMGIQHRKQPIFGVQFHPESLGTSEGKKLISNFLKH